MKTNTTLDGRGNLTRTQGTVQTILLIIVSVTGTWIALYRVPWQVSGDPCLIAIAATVVVVICLWLTRWRGLGAVNFERILLAAFLVGMPLVYVWRYLYASTEHAANYWLWVEVVGTVIFVSFAVLGLKRSPWFLAIGIVLHGVTWDIWHYQNSNYMPDWYAIACLAADLTIGAYVAARVPAYQNASRIG